MVKWTKFIYIYLLIYTIYACKSKYRLIGPLVGPHIFVNNIWKIFFVILFTKFEVTIEEN